MAGHIKIWIPQTTIAHTTIFTIGKTGKGQKNPENLISKKKPNLKKLNEKGDFYKMELSNEEFLAWIKEEMKNQNEVTLRYEDFSFVMQSSGESIEVSSHAQNRIVDTSRNLKKKDMVINLLGKTSKNSKVYTHTDGTKQYDRVNDKNRTLTHIVNKTNVVKSINRFHDTPRARNQAHKNFK